MNTYPPLRISPENSPMLLQGSHAGLKDDIQELRLPIGPCLNELYVLSMHRQAYLGRKLADESNSLWSRLSPATLLGPLHKTRFSEGVIRLQHGTLAPSEKSELFFQATSASGATIHFPFPVMDSTGSEQIAPLPFWQDTERLAEALDHQEQHFRQHSLALLKHRLKPGDVIYDPACSTGTFIAHLARGMPAMHCIGSDICPAMIEHARNRHPLDNLHFAAMDAASSCLAATGCDVLILRFLNAEVMPRQQAIDLFHHLARLVRRGGLLILFGHTPVLFPVELEAQRLGLSVVGCLAQCPETQALFQFFILERA
ncbi:class I SAM-dependent methyltransferase [Pseudomonas sp. S75]|uniref:class I SAM-dependent methyltransferase n=1 Tax=unclassified Pseudomonas TaxID=196821 RepID=UPI001902C449|nr:MULTISPECIES: class I SAM-dependent methyltransferase [unclassified Pseudomonas]MBJ9974335.1 class I SAM-dependent methyltransferase [Pseudomonas sp. S30]MBK0151735.1 class I SAM-dependent methyltransferase [Pseudomonas sp. S75]